MKTKTQHPGVGTESEDWGAEDGDKDADSVPEQWPSESGKSRLKLELEPIGDKASERRSTTRDLIRLVGAAIIGVGIVIVIVDPTMTGEVWQVVSHLAATVLGGIVVHYYDTG